METPGVKIIELCCHAGINEKRAYATHVFLNSRTKSYYYFFAQKK